MTFQLTVVEKPGYLHLIATGQNTREDVLGYMREGLALCEKRSATRILVEERMEGPRLGLLDVFPIAVEMAWKARSVLKEVAFVEVNAQNELSDYAGGLARARGLGVHVFATVKDAEAWLAALPNP